MSSASSTLSSPDTKATAVPVRPWWLTLILGILAVIVGAMLLFGTFATKVDIWTTLVVLLGFYWLFRGISDIIYMFVDHRGWGWRLFMGIVSILAGGAILVYPVVAAVALPQLFMLILGIWGFIQGITLLFLAFRGGGWGAGFLGALELLFGIILIANYGAIGMGLTFIWAAAVCAFVGGFVMIFQAFRQRKA
jgi:uncharacterized membrane protein HdeD (DUF308 family)